MKVGGAARWTGGDASKVLEKNYLHQGTEAGACMFPRQQSWQLLKMLSLHIFLM
jgi:hypothetical protein